MRDDETTGVAVRPAGAARPAETAERPTSATVRLLHGLGGLELGVRHTGRKAMVFVRFRKLVVAGWWKAPTIPETETETETETDAETETETDAAASQNVMHRLWRRFSSALNRSR